MKVFTIILGLFFWWSAAPAWATQQHGAPEGIYVHQAAHLFFALAMGLLIYWLHKWKLARQAGWRHIRLAAYFFIAWNLDTIAAHWIEEQSLLIEAQRIGLMRITIAATEGYDWLAIAFYLLKLDHLLCVPALLLLLLGLKRLLEAPPHTDPAGESAP